MRTATTESGFTVIADDKVRGLFPELLDLFRELPAAVPGEERKNSPKFPHETHYENRQHRSPKETCAAHRGILHRNICV